MTVREFQIDAEVRLAALVCAAAFLLPAMALAGGDGFPNSFAECQQMGGTVERDGDHQVCRYSVQKGDGKAFEECTGDNPKVSVCFTGSNHDSTTQSCSEKFRRRVGQPEGPSGRNSADGLDTLADSLPETTPAKLDKLQELFEKQNGRWSRETIAELVSGRDSLRKGLAERVGSDDSSQRRGAFPLARHVLLEIGPKVWLIDALERIVKRELDDLTPRLRASALEVLYEISRELPDKIWMSPRELEARARELTDTDDETTNEIATELLEDMPGE